MKDLDKHWRVLGNRNFIKSKISEWEEIADRDSESTATTILAILLIADRKIEKTKFVEELKNELRNRKINFTPDNSKHFYGQLLQLEIAFITEDDLIYLSKDGIELYECLLQEDFVSFEEKLFEVVLNNKFGPAILSTKFRPEEIVYPFRIVLNLIIENKKLPIDYVRWVLPFIDSHDTLQMVKNSLAISEKCESINYLPSFEERKNTNSIDKFNSWFMHILIVLEYVKIKDGNYVATKKLEKLSGLKLEIIKLTTIKTIFGNGTKDVNIFDNHIFDYNTTNITKGNKERYGKKSGVTNRLIASLLVLENFVLYGKVIFSNNELAENYKNAIKSLKDPSFENDINDKFHIREFGQNLSSDCGEDAMPSKKNNNSNKDLYILIERGRYLLSPRELKELKKFSEENDIWWIKEHVQKLFEKSNDIFNDIFKKTKYKKLKEIFKNKVSSNDEELKKKYYENIEESVNTHKELEIGNSKSQSYDRDPKLRAILKTYIEIANDSRCEYCDKKLFIKLDGNFYFESHHINPLSENGIDELDNMIGICPECHRKAHHSYEKSLIKQNMLKISKERNKNINFEKFEDFFEVDDEK